MSITYLKHLAIPLFGLLMINVSMADTSLTLSQQEAVKKEVRSELKKLINEEGFLDESLARAIEKYIVKQMKQAQQQKTQGASQKAKNVRQVSPTRDHIYGEPNAPISLIEYSDFECPFCKSYHPKVKKLVEQNPDKVNWVYRHFPLEFHNPGAQKQAEASECAAELGGNEAFWKYTDLIYQRTRSNGNGFPVERLVPLAAEIGLDKRAFKTCLESQRMAERVKQDYQNGVQSGISGTPGSIFINHQTDRIYATAGSIPTPKLQQIVDGLLNEKK